MVIEKTQNRPIRVLLIEETPGDSRLTQEILKNADKFNFKLTITENLVDGLHSFEEE